MLVSLGTSLLSSVGSVAKKSRITWDSIQAIETIYYLSYSDGLHPSNTPLPSYVSGYPASRVSSACSCLVTPATVTGHPVPGYQFYVGPSHFRTLERRRRSRRSSSIPSIPTGNTSEQHC